VQNELSETIVCPHCHRRFEGGSLLGDGSGRRQGIKCPHCRLLVPLDRAQKANGNTPA
jgi:DNA-directed RNA polymerase subunit RPC12/RpoP